MRVVICAAGVRWSQPVTESGDILATDLNESQTKDRALSITILFLSVGPYDLWLVRPNS